MNFSREEMETCCLTDSIDLIHFIDFSSSFVLIPQDFQLLQHVFQC